ncbi:uncharacterized protein LOC134812636 [Bolinopsis microptera]|uniref:uncharacterized protein LOC134812636 n=1 Tax=Bolinopsis microptera TaxID=2820187 RepID=UPI00307AF563
MSDTDYSEYDSDEEPHTHIAHGQTKDTGLLLNGALAKVKHWKSKYLKCNKEKEKGLNVLKDANMKVKNLTEMKLAYDKLKVDSDVDKRDWEIRITNEAEQTKKYQVLLKKNKASLEEMTQKHREIAELNKTNEAKLFQTKIDYAGVVSGVASLEEQLAELKDENRNSKEVMQEQTSNIQALSGENSGLQKDNELLKDRCKELSSQVNEFRNICEKLDKKYGNLAQEHLALKNDSSMNSSSLTKSINVSKEETLQLTKERDSLALNYSHTKEALVDTQKKLEELHELYKKEKSEADENSVLLKQAEMSIQHLKELYTEKESQLKKQTTELESQVCALKKDVENTRALLHEAQSHSKSLEETITCEGKDAEMLANLKETEKEKLLIEIRKFIFQNTGLKDQVCKLKKMNENMEQNYSIHIRKANEQVEGLSKQLSEQSHHLSVVETERERLQVKCNKAKRLSSQTDTTILKLNEQVALTREQKSTLQDKLNKSLNEYQDVEGRVNLVNETLDTEKGNWGLKEQEMTKEIENFKLEVSNLEDQINEIDKNKEALSQENLSLKLQYQEEREALKTNFANLTECNRELEYRVFELGKSREEMENRYGAQLDTCQKKIQLLNNKVNDKTNELETVQTQNNALLIQAERLKVDSEHNKSTITRLSEEADAYRTEHESSREELNQSVNKQEAQELNIRKVNERLENEKIKWSGRECRYLNEIRDIESRNQELKVKLEELTMHYKTEILELSSRLGNKISATEEENSQKMTAMEESIRLLEEVQTDYQEVIRYAVLIIQQSLSRLTPSSHYNPCSHIRTQRGGQQVSSTNTEQIAALNTELGHLTATSGHLNQKITQLEEEKEQDVQRYEKLTEERNQLIKEKNDVEIEMGKQRDAFKEEIRTMKNDMKNNENKHEVLRKKLEGSREELAKMEHEVRGLQTSLADKTNSNERLTEEIGVLKTDNSVMSHQLNELKTTSQERFTEIENLKTRITVIQEDNKNIRLKSDESLSKVKEKEVLYKELLDKLTELQQKLHGDQIKHIEEISVVKEELQEKIYCLESEMKQVKFERDNKESQIVALKGQISKRSEEKVSTSAVPVPTGISEEAAQQYRELYEKFMALQGEVQQLRSEKIILDNSATQLKFNLDTEREKLSATELAIKNTTDLLNDTKEKMGDVQSLNNKASNDITRLEEILKVERDKYCRLSAEHDIERSSIIKLNSSIATFKEQIEKLKENSKQQETEKIAFQKQLMEKEQMLSSEAKLRLHMSSQLSSNSNYETALENERKKAEKLEEKCEVLCGQVERLKTSVEEGETSRRKLREELEEATRPQPNAGQHEDKIRSLKQKLAADRESFKKIQDDLTKKVKKAQLLVKEEAAQRKELTDKYIMVKSEIGELQGKMTVLLADNERLKAQYESLMKEKATVTQEKTELETSLRTDYVLRREVEMSKKNLEARNRVEYNKRLQEMNQKWDQDNKSKEAMDKFKSTTESKIREDLEKSNRQLKQKVTDCLDQFDHREKQLSNIQLENEKLKQILAEERRAMERLLPSFAVDQTPVPRLSLNSTPRAPFRQGDNSNVRATQDANATWQLMKSKLNESLNRYLVEEEISPGRGNIPGILTPGRITPGRVTPGRITPGRVTPSSIRRADLNIDPDPARTSADSFL